MTPEQRERKKAYLREWYRKNRERQLAAVKKWQQENPDRANANKRSYVERHPDKRKESANRYAAKPEVRAKLRESEKRRAYSRERNARDAAELTDTFVRRCMAQHMSITGSQIPQSLVDAHREVMKIKRLLNEHRQ